MNEVYLDNNATTQLDPRVLEAMLPVLASVGNPSSAHTAGQRARNEIEKARHRVAILLRCSPRELVFTSGSTEANNLALQGAARRAPSTRRRIVSVTTEHPAILKTLEALSADGFEVVLVGVDTAGMVDLDAMRDGVGGHCVSAPVDGSRRRSTYSLLPILRCWPKAAACSSAIRPGSCRTGETWAWLKFDSPRIHGCNAALPGASRSERRVADDEPIRADGHADHAATPRVSKEKPSGRTP